MDVAAQGRPVLGAHRRGIGAGRAHPEVARAYVTAGRLTLRIQSPLLQEPPGPIAPRRYTRGVGSRRIRGELVRKQVGHVSRGVVIEAGDQ
jgi:hypothetical protein